MRIIIDTSTSTVIVPNSYYEQIDKMNDVLKKAGTDKKIDYIDYVKTEFGKAIEKPLKRQSDVVKSRPKDK